MAEQENHFTVFIRLPFKRGDFVDPPPVAWSATKERELWDIISRQSKSNEVDWNVLAEQFQVTQQFLLQQAAWLYERQLSQVRAQMRRMGNRQSAIVPSTPSSAAASIMGTQASKRPPAPSSRGPSRLSTQTPPVGTPVDTSVPNTPARSKTSLPLKSNVSGTATGNIRAQPPSSRPLSRKASKEEPSSRTHSRRGSIQHQQTRSPGELRGVELSSSEEEEVATKTTHRRSNPVAAQRRTSSIRKSQHARTSSLSVKQLREQQEEDEDEDDPAFLPFANTSSKADSTSTGPSDISATLRGGLTQPPAPTPPTTSSTRPALQRNHTSERVRPASTTTTAAAPTITGVTATSRQPQYPHQLTSSTSSLSSNNAPPTRNTAQSHTHTHSQSPTSTSHRAAMAAAVNLPTPLSPRQQAALAAAAGLSPRRRAIRSSSGGAGGGGHTHTGSESSPSMGSSFSDLDDASVTQSALEEALMSNMGSTAGGGLGSRVSGISQALRSRYFDARGESQR